MVLILWEATIFVTIHSFGSQSFLLAIAGARKDREHELRATNFQSNPIQTSQILFLSFA